MDKRIHIRLLLINPSEMLDHKGIYNIENNLYYMQIYLGNKIVWVRLPEGLCFLFKAPPP